MPANLTSAAKLNWLKRKVPHEMMLASSTDKRAMHCCKIYLSNNKLERDDVMMLRQHLRIGIPVIILLSHPRWVGRGS